MLELKLLCLDVENKILQLATAYQQSKKENAALKTKNKELREEIVKLKEEKKMQSEQIVKHFFKRGIIINPPEQGLYRFVTHYWIGDSELDAILQTSKEIF